MRSKLRSRRRKSAMGVVATLCSLLGLNASPGWLKPSRWSPRITRSLMGSEMADSVQFIKTIVGDYGGGNMTRGWTAGDATVNAFILSTVHRRATALQSSTRDGINTNLWPGDDAIGRDAARYIRFASAAYGRGMLVDADVMRWEPHWPPMDTLSGHELDTWCFSEHCGIPREDVLKVDLSLDRETHLPGFVLAVDHSTRSVVLSVRGTFHMRDVYTDLLCDSVEFMGGYCHRGLRRGAEKLLSYSKRDLLRALRRHRGYRLVLCGHSMGAGVSTLLTMMILQQRRELGISHRTEILCYAFAPPPVFGPLEELRADAKKAIRSFVCGNDAVPRMSLASAHELARDLKELDAGGVLLRPLSRFMRDLVRPEAGLDTSSFAYDKEEDTYRRFAAVLRRPSTSRRGREGVNGGQNGHKRSVEAFIQEKLGRDYTADGRVRFRLGGDNPQRLLIPGSIFHLQKGGDGGFSSKKNNGAMYWMERRPPKEFTRLMLLPGARQDHHPATYQKALHCIYGDGLPNNS